MGPSSPRLDLAAELSTMCPRSRLQAADFAQNAYWFELIATSISATKVFTYVIAELDPEYHLCLVSRDSFDPHLAASIVQFVRDRQAVLDAVLDLTRPAAILEGFHHQDYRFDCVLVLSPQAHRRFWSTSRTLHSRTFEAIPIYRCEFSGDETAELLRSSKRVPTVDWQRDPVPRIWVFFWNAATGDRNLPEVVPLNRAMHEIHQLPLAEESWVQIDNYLNERILLSFNKREYMVESAATDRRAVAEGEIDGWIKQFLTIGFHPEAPHVISPAIAESETDTCRLWVYLCDCERDRHVDSNKPVAVDLRKALGEFDYLSDTRGCFIGFERSNGDVLQFIWEGDHTLCADIPIPAERGSLVRRGTREELRPLIEKFAGGMPVRELPSFHFKFFDRNDRPGS